MHNNLQASVRVGYAFYAGQSLQYESRIKGGLPRISLGLKGGLPRINLYVTEKSQEVARLASRVSRT